MRDLVLSFKNDGTVVLTATTASESESARHRMSIVFEMLNQRVGEILRKLYDDDFARGGSPPAGDE